MSGRQLGPTWQQVMQAMDGQVEVRATGEGSLALTLVVEGAAEATEDGCEYITVHFDRAQAEEFLVRFREADRALPPGVLP